MMARILKIILAALLFLSFLNTKTFAATAGGSCSKIGSVSTTKVKGKTTKLTCTKVGTKKLWKTISNTTPQTNSYWIPAVTRTINEAACRLPDQRDPSLINTPRSLGFPLNQTGSKASGVVNLGLIAADFPNFQGKATELSKLSAQITEFNNWLNFQSGGRLVANWQFPSQWLRLPKNAADYGVVGFNPLSHNAINNDIITASDPHISYANMDELFVYFPDSLTDSEPNINPFDGVLSQIGGTNVTTSEGVLKHLKGSGTVSKQKQYGLAPTLWALWAHDLLHTIGVEGHNPVESFTLESEDFLNQVVSAWNQYLLGWLSDSQVACIELSTLNGNEVDIVPLQESKSGYRIAIVPLSQTRAIVVESHRAVGYAKDLGASGVLVYLMDTKNVPQYSERQNTGLIGSRFIDPDKVVSGSRARVGKGQKSAIMLPGETASFQGIFIDYVKSGTLDKIRFRTNG
jgi:hypothetical protein